jgi:N-acetylglucosaminyl-diphospho-decaprenol L-rhamnosyltransferase
MAIDTKHYDLAIVVINFRTAELSVDCLKSIYQEIHNLNACVMLVDNCSGDGSIDSILHDISDLDFGKRLLVIRSPINGGFSAGNNLGIKAVQADHYLLTNSDTLIRKEALDILLKTAKTNPKIGLLGPRLEWPDGTPQECGFNYHSPWSELIGSAKTGLITRLLKDKVVARPSSDKSSAYDWVSFASVLIKADVFKDIGYMDEGYFMYFEDVEFCRRAKQAGWEIWQEPAAHIVHLRGGSSPVKAQAKLRKRLPRYYYESRFFFQAYGRLGLLSANLLWTLGWTISSFRSLLSPAYRPDTSEQQWQDIWINFLNPLNPYIHPDNYGK